MPTPGYNRGNELLESLGTFWSKLFAQKDFIRSFTEGVDLAIDDEYFHFLELVLGKSLKDIPVFHRAKWTLLTFKESVMRDATDVGIEYAPDAPVYGQQDPDTVYEPNKTYLYGNFYTNKLYGFKLPDKMVDISSYVTNKIIAPTLVLSKNAEFMIYRNKYILFNKNPFDNPLVPKRSILNTDGTVADREIALWALNSDFDYNYLYKQYGSVIGIKDASSQVYKDLLRTIWAYFTRGATVELVISAANIILGFPVARDTETVQDIRQIAPNEMLITTDFNSYQLAGNLNDTTLLHPSVQVGAILTAFQPLLNLVEVKDTFKDRRWWKNLPFAIFPKAVLGEDYLSALMVLNTNTVFKGIYGATASLKFIADTTPALKSEIQNYGLKYGMPFKYGKNPLDPFVPTEVNLNELDWMLEGFFKNHIFFLRGRFNKYHRFSEAGANAFLDGLPAHTFPLVLFEYALDPEEYAPNNEHVWKVGERRPATAHPVWAKYATKLYRYRPSPLEANLIHFTDEEDDPVCVPSRDSIYYSGTNDDMLALIPESTDASYFHNSDTNTWFHWDGASVWNAMDCDTDVSLIGPLDTPLEVGYGPYLKGNPDFAPDIWVEEGVVYLADRKYRTETVVQNEAGTADYSGVQDGYLGFLEYKANNPVKFGDSGVSYGRKSWFNYLQIHRVQLNCPIS